MMSLEDEKYTELERGGRLSLFLFFELFFLFGMVHSMAFSVLGVGDGGRPQTRVFLRDAIAIDIEYPRTYC